MSNLTVEAHNELERKLKQFRSLVIAHAILLAQKEGTQNITAHHIEKVSTRKINQGNAREKVILLISTVILSGLAFFQLSMTYTQIHLCILPLFSLFWTAIVITSLRDFL